MSDYDNLISSTFGRSNPALPITVGNIDEDPDKAQRALDLAKATGVPGTAIYGDLEEFERQHKAMVASDIVANNPHLAEFVQSNPMVPKIANDDYGNLDKVSESIHPLDFIWKTTKNSLKALVTPPQGFAKGFGEEGLGSWVQSDDLKNHPLGAAIASTGLAPLELFFRSTNAMITHAATSVAGEAEGEKLAQVLADPGLAASLEGIGPHGAILGGALGLMEKFAPAKTFLQHGREPPPTLLPEYDKFLTDQNAQGVDALKEATTNAQASLLRDRNPELFKQFVSQHTDAEIGISGDAVAALYGDKVPAPEDGLLGWVPEIESKLALAKATGDDVRVPLADWLAHVEPEVMQALHDDIRVRPNGITANEAKLAAEANATSPPPIPINEEVPATRAASALEPMLSVGDRKLQLARLVQDKITGQELATRHGDDWASLSDIQRQSWEENAARRGTGSQFGPEQGFHDFSLNDEKGNPVGTINLSEQKGGKHLYIEMVNGINGLGPRDFGPALMKSILRQLKAEFPDAETLGGYRVSGMREKFDTMKEVSIKLDNPKGWDTAETANEFRRILEGGQWERFSQGTQAYIKPLAERSLEDRKIYQAIVEELNRIAPNKLRVGVADRIIAGEAKGQTGAVEPSGIYIQYRDQYPIILASLEGPNPLDTIQHEAIHHLRNYGFITKKEWAILEKAAIDNNWMEDLNIRQRYPAAELPLKLEEAIADAYPSWVRYQRQVPPEVATIFEKIKDLFDRIRERIAELLGKDHPTWEDIFQKIDTGEVGRREGTKPLDARAFDERLSVSEPPEGSRPFQRAASFGMSKERFQAYDKLLQERHAEDIQAASQRAIEERGREQTKQWKDDRKALRQEVAADIRQRPDVAADLFFGAGELYGKKVPLGSVKIDVAKLSDEQKMGLPRSYYSDHGLAPDDVANLFGYGSGDAMIAKLIEYNQAKLAAGGMSAKDFVSRVIDMETDRQMQVRYGALQDNIIDAINEQVSAETQQNLLHEETLFYADKIGQLPATQANIKAAVREMFKSTPISSVDSRRLLTKIGSLGRQIEALHLAQDWESAFRLAQQREYALTTANEMAKVEKELARFDKTAKRFSKREVPSVDQAYTNFIHDILLRVGRPVRRSVQDLETEIQAGEYHSLQDFVEGKNGFYLREVAVADMLFDPAFRKNFEELTVDEFNAVNTSIKSLIANGRDERKITKAGVEADLDEIKGQMIDQLQEFQERTYDAKGGRWMGPIPPKIAKGLRTYGIAHIQMENLFNRWDHDNPNGVFQQYVMRDLVAAANSETAMEKRFAAKLREIDDKADLKKAVDNTMFKVPGTDHLMKLNRGNLRTIMLNMGNQSNLSKMAKGYKLTPEEVTGWVHRHATKEDWDWAQKMGDIFAELKTEADRMYRNLSGVAPESIPIEPVQTPFGQYPGWYYPLIAHPEFEGPVKKMMGKDALEQEGFVRATTANGYTKARTGATYPLALDLDMLPARMKQMIHDISMRPSVVNASKIFYDKDVRSAIFTRFGGEWRDMLVPYLVDVANSANYVPKDQRLFMQASEFIRQNVISTLVGLNPGTIMKHGSTAWIQSMHEVGAGTFLKRAGHDIPERLLEAMKGLFSVNEATSESNWKFAQRNSEELQRRHQNYIETLAGSTDLLQPTTGLASLRSTIQRFSAYPVALSDLISAVPTWMAQYKASINEGLPHGDAVYMADRAVRRAHGSVAITNRSKVMRGGALSQWFASVYGFFNHIMNRQYELLWKSGETLGMVKDGNYRSAMQQAPQLTSMLFAYVLAPALIEEMVTPLMSDDNESWGKKAAKGLAFTLGASWVGVRDVANAILNKRDPSVGLMSTAAKTITDFSRDLGKDAPFGKGHAGKVVKDGATLLGTLTGMVPAQAGRVAQFGIGLAQGTERPKGPWGWLTGLRYGTIDKHPKTFAEWRRHHFGGH